MGLKTPVVVEIAKNVYCINELGLDAMFLAVGSEKALLMDTGTGTLDLNAFIKTITDKPLMVALTHGHVDHAGGIGNFDEVYVHEKDIELARTLAYETRMEFADSFVNLSAPVFDVSKDIVIDFKHMPEFLKIGEGYEFDLGGKHVRVYETPGHTGGGLSYLLVEDRILITGDACNPDTLLFNDGSEGEIECANIDTLLKTAKKIESLSPMYDRNYNGHMGFGANMCFMSMPEKLTRDIIRLCEGLIDGSIEPQSQTDSVFGFDSAVYADTCRIQFNKKYMRAV